ALARVDWEKLTDMQHLDLLRVYAVLFNRMGWPERATRAQLIKRFDPLYPARGRELNAELCQLLVYLEAPSVAGKTLKLMAEAPTQIVGSPRPLIKKWKLDELAPIVERGLKQRDFDRGRRLFGEAQCFACHRFDNEGGAQGPDLTIVSGRFSVRDLLESILDPSKEVSDQYAAVVITTTEGKIVTGRIVNYAGDEMIVMTNMLDPNGLLHVN